jgi:hypothetical protein
MNDILSQIIAYSPNKIDTETKARAMVQGPRNMYAGGQLVQPSADGSRPGYAGQEKGTIRKSLTAKEQKIYDNYVKARKQVKMPNITDDQKVKYKSKVRLGEINNNTVKNLKEKFRYENTNQSLRYDTKLKRWEKTAGKDKKNYIQKPNETKSQFLKRVKNIASTAQDVARTKQSKSMSKTRNYIDNWTTNWFDNNLNKYGVKDFDKMTSNLKKDWQKQIKDSKLNTGFKKSLSTPSGLPNVSVATSARSGGDSFKYGNTNFYTSVEKTKTPLSQWRRLFFENKINTAPGFKEKILDYFDFINQDKRGLYRQADGQTIKAYKNILDKNVVYLLSPDSNLIGSSKNQLFNSIDDEFSKAYNSYSNKINTSKQWKESAAKIEKTLGLKSNYIKNLMDKEKKALAKIFDVKQLPEELRYTLEHGQGLSAAAKTGNKEIMERAVNDLIGTTVKQNTALGFGGFEANRNALVRDITAGVNVEDNLKSLNQLTKNAYQDFGLKGNMYSIKDGQLTSKPISTALTQEDRFGQYFKEIAKTKEGKTAIKEQAGSLKNLLAQLGCPKSLQKASGGRIKFSAGSTCAIKGRKVLEEGLKNGFKESDQALARGILKSGRFLKDAVSLRGLFGPLALGFTVAAEAGLVGYDMLSSGKSFREAVGASVFNYALGDKTKIDSEEEIIKRLQNIKTGPSGLRDFSDEEIGKMQYFKENLKDMGTGFDLYNKLGAIQKNRDSMRNPEDAFSEGAFQLDLDKQEDAVRADIQDYNRTGTPNRVTDYLLSPKATEGADALAKAGLLVEQDQLQDAGTGKFYQSPRGDKKRLDRLSDLKYQLEKMYNPTKINEFGQMFMDATPGEQSYFMGRTDFMEGGIASLNVNKK